MYSNCCRPGLDQKAYLLARGSSGGSKAHFLTSAVAIRSELKQVGVGRNERLMQWDVVRVRNRRLEAEKNPKNPKS